VRTSELRRSSAAGEILAFVVVVGLMVLLPQLGASNRIIFLSVVCVIWAMVSYGLFIPFAIAGQMTVATITAWGAACFAVALAANDWGWGFGSLLLLGIAAGAVAGTLFALPVLRTSGHYFVVVTFAVAALGTIVGQNWALLSPGDAGITVAQQPELLGWHLEDRNDMMRLCAVCLFIVYLGVVALRRSRLGRRLAAVRENEQLARTVGCPVNVYKLAAFGMGGAVVGLAAPLEVFFTRHIEVGDFDILNGITIVVILVLGGRKYALGPVFGALFWYLGPELIGVDALIGQALFGAALAIAIIVFPDGIVAGLLSIARLLGRAVGIRRGAPKADDGSSSGESGEVVDEPAVPTVAATTAVPEVAR
jgi:branched-chain amino acid transport system permease protein